MSPVPKSPIATAECSLDHWDVIRIIILLLLSLIIWCLATGRTDRISWGVPLEYGTLEAADGDAQGVLAYIKAASEGEFAPFHFNNISRVGAPYGAAWSDIPVIEKWQYFIPGMLARVFGLFPAANAAVLISQMLACLCFYVAARLHRCSWLWAFVGGIVFGFSEFSFARSLHHLNVTNCWHIPFCILIAGWISRGQLGSPRDTPYLFSLAISLVIGMQNPYYTNIYLQLVLLGAFYQYFQIGWKGLLPGLAIVGASALGFLLMTADTNFYHLIHGANQGVIARPFHWLEVFSLKFLDLLVPPPTHTLLGIIGKSYYGAAGSHGMVAIPGEIPPSCYLGIIGILSLAWLIVDSARRVLENHGRNLPLEAWQVLWILAYSVMGGMNCIAGALGLTLFRSTNRYSIFILGIVLLYAAKRLSTIKLSLSSALLALVAVTAVALWDQTPPFTSTATIFQQSSVVTDDKEFTEAIESRLPKGAMIFQIPVMEYPESPAPGMLSTDHFRPYLHSKDLRFSFGGVKGRPWLEWQKNLSSMNLQEVVRSLEKYGFSGIYINRNGLPDKAEGIVNTLQALGYTEVISNKRGDLVFIRIHPAPNPILPIGSAE